VNRKGIKGGVLPAVDFINGNRRGRMPIPAKEKRLVLAGLKVVVLVQN